MKSKFKFQVFPSCQDRKNKFLHSFLGEVSAQHFLFWDLLTFIKVRAFSQWILIYCDLLVKSWFLQSNVQNSMVCRIETFKLLEPPQKPRQKESRNLESLYVVGILWIKGSMFRQTPHSTIDMDDKITLESGKNIPLRLLFFEFFSRG